MLRCIPRIGRRGAAGAHAMPPVLRSRHQAIPQQQQQQQWRRQCDRASACQQQAPTPIANTAQGHLPRLSLPGLSLLSLQAGSSDLSFPSLASLPPFLSGPHLNLKA
uniref:Uncharacterized protein n=1 Tax=Haptolina brevifila TaxID=156173 RepID=A0A7S2GIH6_9EUKA|mmetsp:Transcript_37916/g.76056  ORF Transcript_37916/g.76056 Transcript_37916/m.76056 type:complete len:107 (+) Transcript_37916:193-513(+)